MASKYNAARLAPLVASGSSLADVLRALELPLTGGNYRLVRARIRQAGLDTSHWSLRTLRSRVEAIAEDALRDVASRARSIAEVLARFGLPAEGRAHNELSARLQRLGVDVSHMRGRGWSRGETALTNETVASNARRISKSDDEVFVENSSFINNGPGLIARLLKRGWTYRCAVCGIDEWRGQRLVLHLDHVNGIPNDNRLGNLRLLCPNCHSQTETYSNRARPGRACEAPLDSHPCYMSVPPRAWRNW